ncbi:ECF transporter S component [Furfurilactobacillus curtus]|uniref:Membrane protein n=1 Tax=Furfurilactobacillus curtus TaxID=1746200 RepID=A0ABQ5JLA5_9LACO
MGNQSPNRGQLQKLMLTAMLVAVTVVISRLFIIPVPMTHGNINLCDAGIFIAALALGPKVGGTVGALSGFLLDLLSGYAQYMFFSLIIHGLEGFLVGYLSQRLSGTMARWLALGIGGVVMVAGYFLADSLLYGPAVGLVGLATNPIQAVVGGVVAWLVTPRVQPYLAK